jgi:hypothetical protein
MVAVLRQIKGRLFPSTFSSFKYLFQTGKISGETLESLRRLGESVRREEKGLPKTKFMTFSEFKAAYEESH